MKASNTLKSVLMCAAMGLAGMGLYATAHAHDDAFFDSHPSAHGGQMRMSGPFHLELLNESAGVLVYVTDHGGAKIPTAGWQGQAVALSAGKTSHVALKPAGDNTLRGSGALPADAKVVLSVKPKAGEEYSARFTLQPAAGKKH